MAKTAEEIKQDLARMRAEHKQEVQAEVATMISALKETGAIKPCAICGQDLWTGISVVLHGKNMEEVGRAMGPHDTLKCLVLTCGHCLNMRFINLAPVEAMLLAREEANTEEPT